MTTGEGGMVVFKDKILYDKAAAGMIMVMKTIQIYHVGKTVDLAVVLILG